MDEKTKQEVNKILAQAKLSKIRNTIYDIMADHKIPTDEYMDLMADLRDLKRNILDL